MSVPIAVTGLTPKRRISSGVIRVPPPMPVMPTIAPIPKPKMMIAGSMVGRANWLSTFLTCSVRSAECGRIPMVLSVRAISHAYGELEAIERLDLELPAHGVLGLVGPSGCGKSTLLELIAGLRQPSAGEIEVGGGGAPAERLARCAFMPQRDMLLPWLAAIDNAALALRNRGVRRGAARAEAGRLFEQFGLAGFERTRPAELSGGMRQRVAFLRTLVQGQH